MAREAIMEADCGRSGARRACSRVGALACIAVLSGCGAVAWRGQAPPLENAIPLRAPLALAADQALEHLLAAESAAVQVEGAPSKFELYGGITSTKIGSKLAGTSGTTTISWDEAYEGTLGLDVQLVLRKPPRSAMTLAAGDTYLLLHVTIDRFAGQEPVTGQDYDDLTLLGGWIDGRTVLNPLGNTRTVRPYLQYGGGLVQYANDVDRGGTANWAATMALAFHAGLGIEIRTRGLGFYVEAGVQNVSAPNLASGANAVERQAQDLLAYPLRVGVMLAF